VPTRRVGGIGLCLLLWLATDARSAGPDDVQQAIARGVDFLKKSQFDDGTWAFMGPHGDGSHIVGVSSLAGLALLECDVPPNDPVIQKAAQVVRYGMIDIYDTYDLSLAVMFLDRLGDANDEGFIEAAAGRLVAGQNNAGGWGYFCPKVTSDSELRRLRSLVEKNDIKQRDKRPSDPGAPAPGGIPEPPAPPRVGLAGLRLDDNSNTQFATLALWIARRHHLKVDRALTGVESRFRKTQNTDGGWGYWTGAGYRRAGGEMAGSTASMTCAGLLGLAVGYGLDVVLRTAEASKSPVKSDRRASDPTRDPTIRHGLQFLGKVIEPALRVDAGGRGGFRGGPGRGSGTTILGNHLSSEYYFLWSLERVAMLYGLQAINKKDWYAIGSRFILDTQRNDGAWEGNLGATADTCFALFFLRRANLARDLTATLKSKIKDAEVTLRTRDKTGESTDNEAAGVAEKMPEKTAAPSPPAAEKSTSAAPIPTPAPSGNTPPPAPSAPSAVPESADRIVARLRDELVRAAPAEQDLLLDKERSGKGAVHTDVLATAIPLLNGPARTKARDALAGRLARMTAATLRDKLKDGNMEIRRAAALACAMKAEKGFVSDLIPLLSDSESKVARAAHVALKTLTQEDFGPADDANKDEREQAIARWREWQAKSAKSR
jgi:hypothetical protein